MKLSKEDIMFLEEMIAHHKMALKMANKIPEESELYSFAQNIIKVQSAEIEKMKKWLGGEMKTTIDVIQAFIKTL